MVLELRAVEVAGPQRWRWLLVDGHSGMALADYVVNLDPGAAETEAFADLYRFLRWRADPDRRVASEAELLDRTGAWIGSAVLGTRLGRAIVAAAPVLGDLAESGDGWDVRHGGAEELSMLRQGQPLAGALQLALPRALRAASGPGAPPRSVAVPAIFGARAADLVLRPGVRQLSLSTEQPMADFWPEPARFEGRIQQMSTATAVLRPDSNSAGVFFVGPPGIGTTTCALELAYSHQQAFPILTSGATTSGARQSRGFRVVAYLGSFLPARACLLNYRTKS